MNADGSYRSTNGKGILNVYFEKGEERFIGQADPTDESAKRYAQVVEENKRRREAGEPKLPLPEFEYTLGQSDYDKRPFSPTWEGVRRISFVRSKDAVGRAGFQFMGIFVGEKGDYIEHNGITFMVSRLVADAMPLPAARPQD